MSAQVRALVAGLRFLTRIPAPVSIAVDAADLARSTVYFPVIGAIVGAFGAAAYRAAASGWPPFVAAALAVASTAWLTGAFHEDALADAFDGFGGGWSRDQILAIMKDSRVGAYGVIAVAVALAVRLGALAALTPSDAARGLVVAHAAARWSSLPLIRWLPYVRETAGTGKPFAAGVTPARLAVGTAITAAIALAALRERAVPVLAVAILVTAVSGAYFHRRLGGITGDCLGAANQFVEIATYLTLSFRAAP